MMTSLKVLCLAGALAIGAGTGAMAQGIGIDTPFGGVGVYGPDRYAYGYDRYDRYDRYAYGYGRYDRGYRGYHAYGPERDAYALVPGAESWIGPRSNLHLANPHANPDLRRGSTIAEHDQYNSEMGISSAP